LGSHQRIRNICYIYASISHPVEFSMETAFLSIYWLHVPFGLPEWSGTVCIIGTIIILSRVKNKKINKI